MRILKNRRLLRGLRLTSSDSDDVKDVLGRAKAAILSKLIRRALVTSGCTGDEGGERTNGVAYRQD